MSLYVRRSYESQGLHLYLHLVSFSVRVKKHSLINYGNMQNVGLLLKEWDSFTVDVPQLRLLRNYHSDAVSWVSHFNDVLGRVHSQEDQHNSVDELKSILEEGLSLKIQGIVDCFSLDISKAHAIVYFLQFLRFHLCFTVDELPVVEIELKKASCRQKALKVKLLFLLVLFVRIALYFF
jgi:[histone H3]-trimethyl-L-lysine4 demethylase